MTDATLLELSFDFDAYHSLFVIESAPRTLISLSGGLVTCAMGYKSKKGRHFEIRCVVV